MVKTPKVQLEEETATVRLNPPPPSIIRYVVETRSTVGFEKDLRSWFMGTIEP